MAYESMTYELILQRMMSRVTSRYPNLDSREGSIIFNALAPAAVELAIAYSELDNVLAQSFANTATRDYLYILCAQMGMDTTVFDANAGTFKGEFDVEVQLGSRWNCDLYNYVVTEFIEQDATTQYYTYRLTCETLGSAPNSVTGSLGAISDLPSNLNHAELTECLIEGENEYTDDEIRTAYFDFVNSVATDGNVSQYERWCTEYEGIGNYKIFPLWDGDNTVKVSILSSSNRAASDTLIAEFQEYLDPDSEGMGNGIAPIGAIVTVSTATEVPVTVSADVTLKDGYTETTTLNKALEDYFSEIAYETNRVSYMAVGAAILKAEGVNFISNLQLNGSTDDIILGEEEILSLGSANWTVV